MQIKNPKSVLRTQNLLVPFPQPSQTCKCFEGLYYKKKLTVQFDDFFQNLILIEKLDTFCQALLFSAKLTKI